MHSLFNVGGRPDRFRLFQRPGVVMSQTIVGEWRNWFAWYPVKTWQGQQWFRTVQCRRVGVHEYLFNTTMWHWEYR